jgi:hypothetical protein
VRIGSDLMEPWRARPVPFCFQGFLPPPDTMARVLDCNRDKNVRFDAMV